jgi:DNA uptake protein ComE-like DNA-binding protein
METINVNKAPAAYLMQIIHIGAKRADKIIAGRPFRDLYELSKVAGLGKKRMDDILKQDEIILTL